MGLLVGFGGEKQLENTNLRPWLTPWQKGQSGNPNGLAKGTKQGPRAAIRRILRRTLPANRIQKLKEAGYDLKDPRYSDLIAVSMVELACSGDVQAAKLVIEKDEIGNPAGMTFNGPTQVIFALPRCREVKDAPVGMVDGGTIDIGGGEDEAASDV